MILNTLISVVGMQRIWTLDPADTSTECSDCHLALLMLNMPILLSIVMFNIVGSHKERVGNMMEPQFFLASVVSLFTLNVAVAELIFV